MKTIIGFFPLFLALGCVKGLDKNSALKTSSSDSVAASKVTDLYRIPDELLESKGTKQIAQELVKRRTKWMLDQTEDNGTEKGKYSALKNPAEWGIEVTNPTVMIFRSNPQEILNSGEIMNKHQTGTSGGGSDITNLRPFLETKLVGIDIDLSNLAPTNQSTIAKLYKELMQKFGYFGFDLPGEEDHSVETLPSHLLVPGFYIGEEQDAQYGRYGFMLKKETLARTIYSSNNSLRAFAKTPIEKQRLPGWADGFYLPVLAPFFQVPVAALYYGDDPHEGIVYGRLDLSDVEALLIPAKEFNSQSELRKLAASKGVKVMSYTNEENVLVFESKN